MVCRSLLDIARRLFHCCSHAAIYGDASALLERIGTARECHGRPTSVPISISCLPLEKEPVPHPLKCWAKLFCFKCGLAKGIQSELQGSRASCCVCASECQTWPPFNTITGTSGYDHPLSGDCETLLKLHKPAEVRRGAPTPSRTAGRANTTVPAASSTVVMF